MPAKPKILFLDDRSKRIHSAIKQLGEVSSLTIVTNVKECLRMISEQEWKYVFLDHDLGGEEFCDPESRECGMEIVRYLCANEWPSEKKRPIFVIHSSNIFAATTMQEVLRNNDFTAYRRRWQYE